jgi:uncharacterized protein YllA (UPF0747 family)
MNPFVLDWLAGDERATRYLPRGADVSSARRDAEDVHATRLPDLVAALDASNRRWGSRVGSALEKWAAGSTVTIIAGQQTGFAGGPLYTFAKIASLVKMKRDLAAKGVEATIFFWLATEDHDFHEAATLQLPVTLVPGSKQVNRELDLVTLRATRPVDSREIVGPAAIPEPLTRELLSLLDLERPSWLREGITFGDSFAELCASVFAEEEIVYVDALLPELRHAGAPLMRTMFERWQPMQQSIAERSRALESSGYTPQIVARPGEEYTLLFHIEGNGERQIVRDGSMDGLDPASISTSALTRPLLQDFVFAPDIFVGGPSEVAYYAQIAPLHGLLGVSMPRVALRGHALVAPRRVFRFFERFEVDAATMFASPESILAEHEAEGVKRIESIASEARVRLSQEMTEIGELALPADHAVARALNRSIGHIEYHFGKLTSRAVRALVRKDRERFAAVRELTSTFFPDRHVQDRVVGWLPWWQRYGKEMVDRVVEGIEPDSDAFHIIAL